MQDHTGYHFDLRDKATAAGASPEAGRLLLARLTQDPGRANPVDVVQAGLGAVQLGEAWLPVVADAVAWVERTVDDRGRLPYRFPMPHTFALAAPWHSALAQGEAASLLVRAAALLGRDELHGLARHAAASLVEPGSELVVDTADGPMLQEYPTSPPAHVLNGWITALWGLYDLARDGDAAAGDAFDAGVAALAARLDRYRTPLGWSRYDLFPHPVTNVASGFYHRLHVSHLRTLNALAPRAVFAETADDWDASARSAAARSVALARKVLFRAVRPRSRRLDADSRS